MANPYFCMYFVWLVDGLFLMVRCWSCARRTQCSWRPSWSLKWFHRGTRSFWFTATYGYWLMTFSCLSPSFSGPYITYFRTFQNFCLVTLNSLLSLSSPHCIISPTLALMLTCVCGSELILPLRKWTEHSQSDSSESQFLSTQGIWVDNLDKTCA